MTRKEALNTLTSALSVCDLSIFTAEQRDKLSDAVATANEMVEQLAKPRTTDKAKAADKRANARAEAIKDVLPIVRDGLKKFPAGATAEELYNNVAAALPADWTTAKVQYLLLHELAGEVAKTEAKGKPNVYTIK